MSSVWAAPTHSLSTSGPWSSGSRAPASCFFRSPPPFFDLKDELPNTPLHLPADPFARFGSTVTPPPSVFHQRHVGRVLRSSRNRPGRRLASSRGRDHRPGRCPPLW